MKKTVFTFMAVLMLLVFETMAAEANTGFPAEDTWVLNDYGFDIFVKAGTLERKGKSSDAAPNFDTDLIFVRNNESGIVHCECRAKGKLVIKFDGTVVVNEAAAKRLYDAICNQFHHYFYGK